MNDSRPLFLLILAALSLTGCMQSQQESSSNFEIPKPNPTIPTSWNRDIEFSPKGGATRILDGPTTYRQHFEKGWRQYLTEYLDQWPADLDRPFPCQPFSFTVAEGAGYRACKSKITELENRFGRDLVLAEIQRNDPIHTNRHNDNR